MRYLTAILILRELSWRDTPTTLFVDNWVCFIGYESPLVVDYHRSFCQIAGTRYYILLGRTDLQPLLDHYIAATARG